MISIYLKVIPYFFLMSSYWNKISLNRILDSTSKKKSIKYKINTEIGNFYFFFRKEPNDESKITGKLIFFPK